MGSDQQEIRVPWHRQRTSGAHNCGRRTGQEGAGTHRRGGRRSDQSDLVARRPTIAFSGLVGGFTDLFLYDLNSGQLKRLTTDQFAELDPSWSPDGKTLAFSTDRFTTNLQTLEVGDLRLAILDVASGAVKPAGGFEQAKNISPQWTADGRALYFVSDRGGISNIYRMEFGGATTQLTNFLTGASGITELSPALSVADGRVVFSAYEDNGYTIYALETAEQLAGGEVQTLPINAAVLPPRKAGAGPVYAAVTNETLGLPPERAAAVPAEEYKPKLGLDFAGQPVVAVGRDPFGTYAAGGVSFVFSDMLGNHSLYAGAQATSRFDEIGGNVTYINRSHRWNWGVAVDQTPYVYRTFNTGVAFPQGIPTYVEQEYRILQVDRSVSGLLSYPFSRAQRIDFSGGARQIGFSQDLTTRLYDYQTGQQLSEDEESLSDEPNLNLGEASAALVYDTSINGITSPIRGTRYRLEVAQTGGSLTFTGLTSDLRTYLMPVKPFTFALRGLFFGRYGTDAEEFRLPTLYLGYRGWCAATTSRRSNPASARCSTRTCPARSSIACLAAVSPSSTPRCGSRCGARSAATTSTDRCRLKWRCSPTAAWRGARTTACSSAARTRSRSRASAWRCASISSASPSASSTTSGRSIARTAAGSGSST